MTKEAKLRNKKELLKALDPLVSEWFFSQFKEFSLPQLYGVLPIHERKNILISAPTGGTKTLTAFLSILHYLISLARRQELEDKIYCVYVSPLKALNNDVAVNLITPLQQIQKIAKKQKVKLQDIRVAVRTGDTTVKEKSAMLRKAPHILITTPESLAIVLSSMRFIEHLKAVEFCIVDEIHALACNKRGVHLSLSLERLYELSVIKPIRIGLSATIAPLEEVAKFLVGYENGKERDCLTADVQFLKKTNLKVLSPIPDMIDTTASKLQTGLYSLLDRLIQEHRTTLIFTNTRSATERVINHLKEMFPKRYLEDIGAHHSSLSKKLRFNIEQRLREGKLRVVVTSTSLELGIDIGYIDLVLLLGSPKSVARALQRCGRAGHRLHDTSKGRLIVLDRDDLVECAVILKEAIEKKIDRIHIPQNCLDVLSQHIYGMAIQQRWNISKLLEVIKRSYCYHNLSREDFMSTISYLAGEYALEARHVYAKIWYDPQSKELGKRGRLARMIYMTNIGTIPEESYINVIAARPRDRREEKIGMIDEAFLERLRKGDVFVLGGQKYEFLYTRGMNAYVNASVYRPPTIPSWFSEMLPLSFDLALAIQHFRRLLDDTFSSKTKSSKTKESKIKDFIQDYLYADRNSVDSIYEYFYEQYHYSKIPHEKRFLIEHYRDMGKHYAVFHSLYGRRVNDALSRAIAYLVAKAGGRDIEIGINDNGFFLASSEKMQVEKALKMLEPKNLRTLLAEAVEKTEVFKRRFRHCAARSLMILRSYKGKKKTAGKMQMRSGFILAAARKVSKDFPILKETRREILEDLMDIANACRVLGWIKEGKMKIETAHVELPSPFALGLVTQGRADLLKIEDKIEFLKRMHAAIMQKIKSKGKKQR